MEERFEYYITLNKDETNRLRDKYREDFAPADFIINSTLWQESSNIKEHWIRAGREILVNDDYLRLKVSADTLEGLKVGVEYLKGFVNR